MTCNNCGLDMAVHPFCSRTGLAHQVETVESPKLQPSKTRICRHFEKGYCRLGNECGFAHGVSELRRQKSGSESDTPSTPSVGPTTAVAPPPVDGLSLDLLAAFQARLGAPTMMGVPIQQIAPQAPPPAPAASAVPAAQQPAVGRPISLPAGQQLPAPKELTAVSEPAKMKTRLCRHFERGYCRFGATCGFAHGAHELKTKVLSEADVTPQAETVVEEMFMVRKDAAGRIGATLTGTLVSAVAPGGPFASAGIRAGVKVVKVNGGKVGSIEDVKLAVQTASEVFTVTVEDASLSSSSDSSLSESHSDTCSTATVGPSEEEGPPALSRPFDNDDLFEGVEEDEDGMPLLPAW